MLLATPLHPHSFTTQNASEDSSKYRPSQDFKSLLAPIEFVEGSSSGGLAVPEGRYEPINGTPKASKVAMEETVKGSRVTPAKSATASMTSTGQNGKSLLMLYNGTPDITWPTGTKVGAGLYNSGNTCFLNSALQCLLHTAPLLHVLLAHGKKDPCHVNKAQFCMSCALRTVMTEAHTAKHAISPKAISMRLTTIAKHMRKGRQEDSHEFLRYAIDALQKSCLAGMSPKIDPKVAETTWIHKIFGGQLRSRVTCRECHHNSDTFDSILDLSLDILHQSSLKEALHHFVKVDTLKGADKYKCEKCKKPVIAEKRFTIHTAPSVLTVHLKRFSPLGRKISHHIQYEERLSLQPVMSEGQYGPSYSLYGVICHAGGGPNSGHYFAHVKGADGRWYEMNDESVTMTRAPTGLRNAYMLFYILEKGQALEAAVSQTAIPTKNGVAAGMKKRKADDEREDTGVATTRPFIGPQLPSPSSVLVASSSLKAIDPQADAVKKKIEAAAKARASQVLRDLSQYADEDGDSDRDGALDNQSSSAAPTPHNAQSSPPPAPPASSPVTPLSIPASNFYNSSNGKDKGKKRKSPDSDIDENKQKPHDSSHHRTNGPKPQRRGEQPTKQRYSGNPYNRFSGSDNLHRRDSKYKPITTYKRRRGFAI